MNRPEELSNTAILIFANSPEEEAKQKRFLPGSIRRSTQIARLLFRQTLQVARKTKLPIFLIPSSLQEGNSFQHRLSNAIESVWQKGFEKQLVIGSDTPGLSTEMLLRAAKQLEQNDWVLGPAIDGGAYIIGLHKKDYQREGFLNLPWQTENLFCKLAWHFSDQSMRGACLPALVDVDSHQDLHVLISSQNIITGLIRRIQVLFLFQTPVFPAMPTFVERRFLSYINLRGPPVS